MQIRSLGRAFQRVGFGLVALLIAASAARATGDGDATPDLRTEARAAQVENLIGELLGSNLATPEYTDHGGGLHSLSISLDPNQRERLSSLVQEGLGGKAVAYYFLAAGQSLTPPSNAGALVHAAISNAQLGYNYWVAVLNLGSNVTRNTVFKLTGPGRTFNRTFPLLYRANTIWFYWYEASSVGAPGFYHYVSTVAGAGTFTIHTAAMNP
jgi:hypothetical protein